MTEDEWFKNIAVGASTQLEKHDDGLNHWADWASSGFNALRVKPDDAARFLFTSERRQWRLPHKSVLVMLPAAIFAPWSWVLLSDTYFDSRQDETDDGVVAWALKHLSPFNPDQGLDGPMHGMAMLDRPRLQLARPLTPIDLFSIYGTSSDLCCAAMETMGSPTAPGWEGGTTREQYVRFADCALAAIRTAAQAVLWWQEYKSSCHRQSFTIRRPGAARSNRLSAMQWVLRTPTAARRGIAGNALVSAARMEAQRKPSRVHVVRGHWKLGGKTWVAPYLRGHGDTAFAHEYVT
jgi:hypothetical protein